GLDAARRYDLARRVDDARGGGGQRAGKRHRRDALAFDAHVPGAGAVGCDDLSAANHEIEHDEPPLSEGASTAPSEPPLETGCAGKPALERRHAHALARVL